FSRRAGAFGQGRRSSPVARGRPSAPRRDGLRTDGATVTPILLALAAFAAPQAAPAPASDQALSQRCLADVRADAEKAVATANDWRMRGGGWLARQCLGLAYSSLGRWEPAATAFDQAAAEAEVKRDPHHADLLVQGGNSWLAAGDPVKARKDFDAALALGSLANELRGEVLLDRARAGV